MSRLSLPRAAQFYIPSHFARLARKSVIMATSADRENLTDTAEQKVKWGSYGPKVATNLATGIYVNSNFDGGNMDVIDIKPDGHIQLAINEDAYCEVDGRAHYQWFFFRVSNVQGRPLTMSIMNAGKASYPEGWKGYNACCSYDRKTWRRVPTTYNEELGHLVIEYTPEHNSAHFAYFAPYTLDMHMHLIAKFQLAPQVKLQMLGETLDGHDLDMLVVGEPGPAKKKVWVIARQHPGETMAEWFVEGFLDRLTDRHDSVARSLLDKAVLYVVPNMNPVRPHYTECLAAALFRNCLRAMQDGSWRGYLRTNAAGSNLNRCWKEPSLAECPEVYFTQRKMRETGVDMCIDVHGDEAIPANFIACAEGIPGYTDKMKANKVQFCQFLEVANPDFQTELGYPETKPGESCLRKATDAVAQEFDCFSFTLEMPFKDSASFPDPEYGWNPERAKKFGGSFVTAIRQIVPSL